MAKAEEELVVEWTKTAERQFYGVLEFWNSKNQSTNFSEKLAKLTWHKIIYIQKHPFASKALQKINVRMAVMGHYSLIYKLADQKIILMSFWDNRQQPKKLLEILKLYPK